MAITKNITNEKMMRLQRFLPIIRNLAGWTAEDLGERIGVTRQTITNLEKSEGLALTKTQYIAIRAVLDYEIAETENTTLADTIKLLVDTDNLTDDQKEQIDEVIKRITEKKSRRVNDELVKKGMIALTATLGTVGSIAASQVLKKGMVVPGWLLDLMK